jgi:diguanylate cyclase (GGDEF)-like protein
MDVDRFKQFNDNFGHPAGDDVLKTVGRILMDCARTEDFVARYGGEEFVIVLPDTDAAAAKIVGERLRAGIESAQWPMRAVTASFGIAGIDAGIDDRAVLIAEADRALYVSKESGRNRVTHIADIHARLAA